MHKPVRLVTDSTSDTAFTAQDYAQLMEFGPFEAMRVELVCGELRKTVLSGLAHGEMNGTLAFRLRDAFTGTDRRFATGLAIEIDRLSVRGGDIVVVLPDTPGNGPVPAQYVVMVAEIALTTLARDIGEKLVDYARAGIPDYWIADLEAGVMHVMRLPEGDHYRERSVIPFGTPIAVPGTDRTITIA